MKRRLAYQACCVIAALWAMQQAASAAGIGTVVDVVNEGYRTPPGEDERRAQPADDLVQEEALRTEAESIIQVRFVDGSELSVEADSEVVLSDYVFDPNGSSATGTINLNEGLFHFTSNGAPDQGLTLRTPVATIGVRGTEFLVHVDGDEATIIDILSGSVEARPHGSGKAITCNEAQSILIASADDDAVCGDIGSFSTAAGPGTTPSPDPEPGQKGSDTERSELAERPQPPEPPAEEPEPEPDPEPDECPDYNDYNYDYNYDYTDLPCYCDPPVALGAAATRSVTPAVTEPQPTRTRKTRTTESSDDAGGPSRTR